MAPHSGQPPYPELEWPQQPSSLFGRLSSALVRSFLAGPQMGRLCVVTPVGAQIVSASSGDGPDAKVVLHRWRAVWRLLLGGDVALAESYIDGDWSSPDLAALVEWGAVNGEGFRRRISGYLPARLLNRFHHALKRNSKRGSRRNIVSHYDLGNEFYASWLDRDMHYSSALFRRANQTLEDAQVAKLDKVVAALALTGGERVLEIGCGWGGLSEKLARMGCQVTALTLSPSQLTYAQDRAARAGLADRIEFRLQDYRDVRGTFDRIVSVEMIEAVGRDYWPIFFGSLRDRLAPDGLVILQAITMADARFPFYTQTPDFIQRYIFPGGMLPSPAILQRESAAAGLALTTELTFGDSYARTLADWRTRFQLAWPQIQSLGFDRTFKRLWEYYLAYCEGGFRGGATDVGLYSIVQAGRGAATAAIGPPASRG